MVVFPFGDERIMRLVEAIGLDPMKTVKVVIEITPDDFVKAYAVLAVTADEIRKVSELFEVREVSDVKVSNRGEVSVTELPIVEPV